MAFTPDQYERFWTQELDKYQHTGTGHLRASCPVHGGDSPDTLSVDLKTGFAYCFKCHNGNKGWNMIEFTMARYNMNHQCAWDHVRYVIGESPSPTIALWKFPFLKPLAVTTDEWRLGTLARRIEQYIEYLDAQDEPCGPGWEAYALYIYETIESVKVRVRHKVTGEKRMLWLSMTAKGGWTKPSKLGLQAPPYRARSLAGQTEIWLLNGEKAVDRAASEWGVAATCLPNGEGHWREEYLPWFRDAATVFCVLDNDESGEKHGAVVGGALAFNDIETRLVRLPGLAPKADLFDWMEQGGTAGEARMIALASPLALAAQPAPAPVKDKVREMPKRTPPPPPGGGGPDAPIEGPDLVGHDRNDGGNAARLVAFAGSRLNYARHLEEPWLFFDGTRWKQGAVEEAYGPATETLALLKRQADAREDTKLWKFADQKQNHGGIRAMIDLAKQPLAIEIDQLDRQPHLINCTNGTFDLETGELREHRPADRLTHIFPFAYQPGLAEPELFIRSLWEWFGGTPDSGEGDLDRIDRQVSYVRRVFGYLLTGGVHEKAFFVLYGTGNNGKSTFITTMQAVLGEYAVTISPATLTRSARRNENNSNADIARTKGARAIFASETHEGEKFDQALIKMLTQGDVAITGVFKGKQPFSFLPTGKLILETNSIPAFDDQDRAFIDRMHTIEFPVKFPGGARAGQTRRDRLRAEDAQIFNWAIGGAREQYSDGLGEPLEDRALQLRKIQDAQARNDGLEPFLEENFEIIPHRSCLMAEVEALYRPWCERNRVRPLPRNLLSRRLTARIGITHGNDPADRKEAAWLKGLAPRRQGSQSYGGKDFQYKDANEEELSQ